MRLEFVNYLNKIGKEAGLQSFEQAKNIYLELEPFLSRGILTNTMKIQRHEAKKYYRAQIDQLYKEGVLKAWLPSILINDIYFIQIMAIIWQKMY